MSQDAEERFAEDAAAHLGGALLAVDEDDRHLGELHAQAPGRILHLDLESVAFHLDAIQVDGLQRPTRITNEPGSSVVQRHTGNDTDIFRSEERHQQPRHGPVDHVDTLDVTRPDHDIVALGRSGEQPHQVVGVVGEVAVHLAHEFETVLQSPAETGKVSCAETQLAAALQQMQPLGKLLLPLLDGCVSWQKTFRVIVRTSRPSDC